jgi:anti-sigma B factor antagonist
MELETITAGGGATVVSPYGRLNMVSAPRLRDHLESLAGSGRHQLVVDLSGTTFVDSSGLGALVGGLKAARRVGGDLRVANPTPAVRATMELTNLDRLLRLAPADA